MIYAEIPDEFTLTLRAYLETVPKIKTAFPIHYLHILPPVDAVQHQLWKWR